MANKSLSCQTLQYGTNLLGHNAEGPPGDTTNLDYLIQVLRLLYVFN